MGLLGLRRPITPPKIVLLGCLGELDRTYLTERLVIQREVYGFST